MMRQQNQNSTRSVRFCDMVHTFDAYDYCRNGYKNGQPKKYWKCERISHDRNPRFFYCEVEEADADAGQISDD